MKCNELIKGKAYVLVEEECKWIFKYSRRAKNGHVFSNGQCNVEGEEVDESWTETESTCRCLFNDDDLNDRYISLREATDSEIKILEEACSSQKN